MAIGLLQYVAHEHRLNGQRRTHDAPRHVAARRQRRTKKIHREPERPGWSDARTLCEPRTRQPRRGNYEWQSEPPTPGIAASEQPPKKRERKQAHRQRCHGEDDFVSKVSTRMSARLSCGQPTLQEQNPPHQNRGAAPPTRPPPRCTEQIAAAGEHAQRYLGQSARSSSADAPLTPPTPFHLRRLGLT